MTRNLFSTLILFLLCTTLLVLCFVIVSSAQTEQSRPAHIGLVYPLSSNGTEAPDCVNNFSFHVLYGVSLREKAFCLSGIGSIVKEDVRGTVLSGVFNRVGTNVDGASIAGVLNIIQQQTHGAAIAGFMNINGSVQGAQVAGFANISGNAAGIQLAGFMNVAKNAANQVSGFSNISHDNGCLQLAGFINQAKNAHNQVSGFINIAKKVKGVQVAGFINIAEESKYPIGLVNIIKNGEKQIGVTVDETGNTLLGFRSGGEVLYGILAAGINAKEDNARYVLEGGIGAHFPINRYFRLNMEISNTVMSDIRYDVYFKSSARLLAGLKLMNRVEIFAGPTFNHLNFDRFQTDIRSDKYIWSRKGYSTFNGLFIGAMAGVQVNI